MQEFPFNEIAELYRDVILDHYRRSRVKSPVENPDIQYDEYNPICGDRVVLQLKLRGSTIEKAGFEGEGCSISQACASMLTETLKGKTLKEAEALSGTFRQVMNGHTPSEDELAELGDLEALQGVRKFPVRIKCALLAWSALEQGVESYRATTSKN